MSVPEMIKYLCLIYFNPNKDEFDPNQCHKKIRIHGNSIIAPAAMMFVRNAYLKNVVSSSVHVWKFKYNGNDYGYYMGHDMIGIFDMDYKQFMSTEGYWDNNGGSGYGFASNGQLTNKEDATDWGRQYGVTWERGDEIEMKLDLNANNLKFKVNDNDYGVAFEIDAKKEWRAAISIGRTEEGQHGFELISYQQLY